MLTIFTAFTIAACSHTPDATQPTNAAADCRMVQHAMGETCVPQNPQRIVTLTLPALANLIALDVKPVGTATYEAFAGVKVQPYIADKVNGVELLGSDDQPSLEKLSLLKPDLILGLEKQHQAIYQRLSQIAPTVLFKLGDRSDWKSLVASVAAAIGKPEAGDRLLAKYADRIQQLKTKLGERGRQLTVSIAFALGGEIYSEAKNSFPGSIFDDIGLRRPPAQNVTAQNSGRLTFSQERIDSIDGDVLFVPESGNDLDRAQQELMQKPLWQTLKAVKQGRVYRVNLWEWTGLDILAAHKVLNDLSNYLVRP